MSMKNILVGSFRPRIKVLCVEPFQSSLAHFVFKDIMKTIFMTKIVYVIVHLIWDKYYER